jgi:hypothetical protein
MVDVRPKIFSHHLDEQKKDIFTIKKNYLLIFFSLRKIAKQLLSNIVFFKNVKLLSGHKVILHCFFYARSLNGR